MQQINKEINKIRIDDIKLDSTEGLEIIPIEILNQGTQSIVQYILDLYKSPYSKPLYKTKLMVVGYESIGKTTILDCLFPLMSLGEMKKQNKKTFYYFELQGKIFKKYKLNDSTKPPKNIIIEEKQWSVQEIEETKLTLTPLANNKKKKKKIDFKDEPTRDKWVERFKRVILNSATHGIDINEEFLFKENKSESDGKPSESMKGNKQLFGSVRIGRTQSGSDLELIKRTASFNTPRSIINSRSNSTTDFGSTRNGLPQLGVSIWDFAGQYDYYNTHHYFISTRTVFLVLWKMKDGDKGMEGLNFWFKSLSSHLPPDSTTAYSKKPFFSIFVVGTFLDDSSVSKTPESKKLREEKIHQLAKSNGIFYPIEIYEVSCHPKHMENIDALKNGIYDAASNHAYMGERLPLGYLHIKKSIEELKKQAEYKNLPIIDLQKLIEYCKKTSNLNFGQEFTKRGLRLLHQWGSCIYFDSSQDLSKFVILDPQYFTKKVLGDFFNADASNKKTRENGIIEYSQLKTIWSSSTDTNLIDIYLSFLEKFEVCFVLDNQKNGNENENGKKVIIPNLLPDFHLIEEMKTKNRRRNEELEYQANQIEATQLQIEKKRLKEENQKVQEMETRMKRIQEKLERKWPSTSPYGTIEIERIFSFNQVPSEMVSRLLVRFHDKIVNNIIWRRGVLLKHFDNDNILCLLKVNMVENLFENKIRGKERKECLKMMEYIFQEITIVNNNYGGIIWKECVRSPHFSKGLIILDEVIEDCKLELKDRKLICPITHFPIYGEELLFKAGLLEALENQDSFGILLFFFFFF